jgi:hypothetical protein
MSRSRTDVLLEGWKMASHSAQRPEAPPSTGTSRAALPLGLVAAAAVVILALVVGSRMLSSGPGPALPAVGASAPAATATPAPTAVPSTLAAQPPTAQPATPAPTAKPSAATGSPTAGDIAAAKAFVESYTALLKKPDTTSAWQMLGYREQLKQLSEAQWATERYQFFQGVKSYTVTANPKDVQPIAAWLKGTNGASIDLGHAVLVKVQYSGVAGPADWDLYIVNKTADGLEIYSVR